MIDTLKVNELLGANRPENAPRHEPTIFITPIAQKYKDTLGEPCSRRDWEEQVERMLDGHQLMWDGPSQRITQPLVGDLMVIWKHKKPITIYTITNVVSSKKRLKSWSSNIGQTDRCVVYLNNPKVIEWDQWIILGGHKRCMGTGTLINAAPQILDHLVNI